MEEKIQLENNVIPKDKSTIGYFREKYDETSLSVLGLDVDMTQDKKGVFIFVSSLGHEEAGGQGAMYPVENQDLVVYKSNWNDITTYVHEVGHVIGLTHSFWGEKDVATIDWAFKSVEDTIERIRQLQRRLQLLQEKEKEKEGLTSKEKEEKQDLKDKLDELSKNSVTYRNYLATLKRCKYRFRQKSTDNYMDYSKLTFSFFSWQWEIMRSEILFYHS